MKPVIGLIPLWDDDKNSLWMLPGYMEGVAAAGGLPVMLPLTDDKETLAQACAMCDGFLLTGGHDVSPWVYGAEDPNHLCGTCEARDRMEQIVLQTALEAKKPVLGICRGIQFLNAALGGTLYQDLPTEHASSVDHHQTMPYDRPQHSVTLLPDTPLHTLLCRDTLPVNSYHHQAVKQVAPCLVPMAVSEDGLVEALYHPNQPFCWAVQWHPEFSWKVDAASRKIFEAFVGACKG